jgi:hypothetical protein
MLVVMREVRVRTLMRDGQEREPVSRLAILATSAVEAERSNENCFWDAAYILHSDPSRHRRHAGCVQDLAARDRERRPSLGLAACLASPFEHLRVEGRRCRLPYSSLFA